MKANKYSIFWCTFSEYLPCLIYQNLPQKHKLNLKFLVWCGYTGLLHRFFKELEQLAVIFVKKVLFDWISGLKEAIKMTGNLPMNDIYCHQ